MRSCTISYDIWPPRYRTLDESAIDIAISCNRYDHYGSPGWSRKKGRKTVVVVVWCVQFASCLCLSTTEKLSNSSDVILELSSSFLPVCVSEGKNYRVKSGKYNSVKALKGMKSLIPTRENKSPVSSVDRLNYCLCGKVYKS